MIQKTHTSEPDGQFRKRCSIAAIGITSRNIWDICRLFIPYDRTIVTNHILSPLQCTDLRQCQTVFRNRVLMHIVLRHLLPQHETEGLDTMIERECQKFHIPVGIQNLRSGHFKRHEIDFKQDSFSEPGHEEVKCRSEGFRSINVQLRRAAEHGHSGKQAENAENMIAMDMGQTDVFDLQEGDPCPAQTHLDTFSTVNHKQAPMYIQYLGARISFSRGQGRSRAQDFQSEIHRILLTLELALESCKCIEVTESSLLDVRVDLLHSLLSAVSLSGSLLSSFLYCCSISLCM